VLVTGASGFLGRHVARLLSEGGKTVVGIGHGSWKYEEWRAWGLSAWHESDITLSELRQCGDPPVTIVHCGGSGSVALSLREPLEDLARTVVTTANVLEFIRLDAPGCNMIYPSSASVYGATDALPIHENLQPSPISPYGTHKLMAEQLIASHARQFGTSAAIVRFFSIFGPGLRKQLLWDASAKLSRGEMEFMGTGDEQRDWLYVEDAAELLVVATRYAAPECPVVNGGCGEGISVREILTYLKDCLLDQQKALTFSGAQRIGDPNRYIADVRLAKEWGWQPKVGWKQGVEAYVRWWKTTA
jgi:UDP-glucose 4-epimerase